MKTMIYAIKKFNDLKNEWKKAGSAGRKADNKLWDKFNKSADRFFTAKKEVIDDEVAKANNLLEQLQNNEITLNDTTKALSELKNISKTKEYTLIQKHVKNIKKSKQLFKRKIRLIHI